jgi:hypothetical protein
MGIPPAGEGNRVFDEFIAGGNRQLVQLVQLVQYRRQSLVVDIHSNVSRPKMLRRSLPYGGKCI